MSRVTQKERLQAFREALRDIARAVLPTYDVDGKRMVPIENADYLRQMAKDALGEHESEPR